MFFPGRVFRFGSYPLRIIYRTFLSDGYKCTTEWQSRLSAPFMEKVNLDTMFYDIDQTFLQQGKASPIDVDIFINKVSLSSESYTDEILDLLHRMRLTEESSNALESTGHAAIRNLLDSGHINELMMVLDDRLSYGVFLDNYIANYALNEFIKNNDFHSAARIATFLMLQEDFENEINRVLSLYACYRYLEKCEPFYPPKEENSDEPKEEIKVRVKYIRNEYFDDHFDLRDNKCLIGKTFSMIGKQMPEEIGKSAELLGWILYQKYDKALELVKNAGNKFYKDVIIKSLEELEQVKDNEIVNELRQILSSNKNIIESSFNKDLEKIIQEIVARNELIEIEKQKKVYLDWNNIRENKLKQEQERLMRAKRLKVIEKITEDMKKEEEKLWFFENEEEIDLLIDSKAVSESNKELMKKKDSKAIDENYIPPEVSQRRS